MQNPENNRNYIDNNEIDELTKELAALELQANNIQQRLQQIRERNENQTNNTENRTRRNENKNRPLSTGDSVIVTNKYKGRQGVTGTIVRLTSTQAIIQPTDGGEAFRKYKANLRRL